MRAAESDAYSCTVLMFRCPDSPQTVKMDALVLGLFEKARIANYAVIRAVVVSFGRSTKITPLASATTSTADKEGIEAF